MKGFPAEGWWHRAVEAFNEDPDAGEASVGWTFDFGIVVRRDVSALGVYVGPPHGGRLPPPRLLSERQLEALEPEYWAAADEATWLELIEGALDPIAAIVHKKLVVRGDLEPIAQRLQYRGLARRWLKRIADLP